MCHFADSILRSRHYFATRVTRAEELTNSVSGTRFVHCVTELFNGTIDVVASTDLLPEQPPPGSVLLGEFWFSGRLVPESE